MTLTEAIEEMSVEEVKKAISNGVNINNKNDRGETPLIQAIHLQDYDVVETLLEAGADVNARDCHGQTPLIVAVTRADIEMVRILLDMEPDIHVKDYHGYTALMWAKEKKTGNVRRGSGISWVKINKKTEKGIIPLLINAELSYAIDENDLETVKQAIKDGASVNEKNVCGIPPLCLAAWGHGNIEVVKALLQAKADIDAKDWDGNTALFYPRNAEIAHALIVAGATINIKNKKGETPLSIAKKRGNKEIIKLLTCTGTTKTDNTNEKMKRTR